MDLTFKRAERQFTNNCNETHAGNCKGGEDKQYKTKRGTSFGWWVLKSEEDIFERRSEGQRGASILLVEGTVGRGTVPRAENGKADKI